MLRPLLFLDVDGVLNPFPDAPAGYEEYDFFPEDNEPVRLASAHRDWLHELAGVYEPVWATGWGEEANRLLNPLFGLPDFPVVLPRPEGANEIYGVMTLDSDNELAAFSRDDGGWYAFEPAAKAYRPPVCY